MLSSTAIPKTTDATKLVVKLSGIPIQPKTPKKTTKDTKGKGEKK